MVLLPDFLCFLCFCAMMMTLPFFFRRPCILRYRAERHSRGTTTTGVSAECTCGISKMMFGLLESATIIFRGGNFQLCNIVMQIKVAETLSKQMRLCIRGKARWGKVGLHSFVAKETKCLFIVCWIKNNVPRITKNRERKELSFWAPLGQRVHQSGC